MWYSRHNAHGYMQVPCVNLSARQPVLCSEHRIWTDNYIVEGITIPYIVYKRNHICEDPSSSRGWTCSAPLICDINPTWTSLLCSGRKGWDSRVAWAQCPGSRNDQRSRLNPLRTRIYDLKRIARSPSIWCSSVRLTIWADYWLLTGKIEC